jgi:hypothetical protein
MCGISRLALLMKDQATVSVKFVLGVIMSYGSWITTCDPLHVNPGLLAVCVCYVYDRLMGFVAGPTMGHYFRIDHVGPCSDGSRISLWRW